MKNELFVGTIQHEPVKILNPTFSDGMSSWVVDGTDYGYIVDNIYFFGKETSTGTTISLSQIDKISEIGQYKVTFELFFQEECLGGSLDVVLGDKIYTVREEKFYSLIFNVTDVTNKNIIFYSKDLFRGGITNIKIESADITYTNIDLIDDTTIPINFNIADIKDFSKKNASYSKTITLPGTYENNKFFKHIYNVNTFGAYIMNKPVPCYLLQDTQEVFVGSFELMNVTILKDNSYEYEINIYSTFISLYTRMGNKLIVNNPNRADDIPLSEFNHIKDYDTVNNKLIANVTEYAKGGVYNTPGLNTGYDENSFDYVFIDKGGRYLDKQQPISAQQFSVSDMTCTLPVKVVLDKIFEKTGFKYESEFLNSYNFKRLIMPYPNYDMTYSKSTLDKYKVVAKNNTTDNNYSKFINHTVTHPPMLEYKDQFFSNVEQITNTYNLGSFRCKIGGKYKTTINKNLEISIEQFLPSPGVETWLSYTVDNGTLFYVKAHLKMVHNKINGGTSWYTIDTYEEGFNAHAEDQGEFDSLTNPLTLNDGKRILHTFNSQELLIDMVEGDTIKMFIEMQILNSMPTFLFRKNPLADGYVETGFYFKATTIGEETFTFELQPIKTEGSYIYGRDIPHQNFKQSDFVTSLIKMFNLYIEPKSSDTLIIEPRDDYYSNFGEYKDWTDKAIINKEIKVERPSDLPEKLLNIKYDSDIDWFNISYLSGTYKEYGEYLKYGEYNIDSSNKTEIKVTFAPTVCGPLQNGRKILMPKIFDLKEDGTVDKTKSHKPRILFRGDKVDYNYSGFLLMRSDLDNSKTSLFYSEFPSYISHFNKPYGLEDWNINFDSLIYNYESETWAEGIGETWNNLYNMYYAKMINQITDPDARLVTMYFDFKPSDIANFSFADTILVKDTVYNVNKISDYIPGQPTKVELLKVVDVILTEEDYSVSDVIIVPPIISTTAYLDLVEAKKQNSYVLDSLNVDLIDGVSFDPINNYPRRPSNVFIDIMDFGYVQGDNTPLSILKTFYKPTVGVIINGNILENNNQNTQ